MQVVIFSDLHNTLCTNESYRIEAYQVVWNRMLSITKNARILMCRDVLYIRDNPSFVYRPTMYRQSNALRSLEKKNKLQNWRSAHSIQLKQLEQ